MSHHLIAPSVDAEKNSVLVLDWIQNAWFAGFLSRIVGENEEERNGSDEDYNLAAKRQALWKHFATVTAEIATAFTKRINCNDP